MHIVLHKVNTDGPERRFRRGYRLDHSNREDNVYCDRWRRNVLAHGQGKDGWHMDMAIKDTFGLLWRKYFSTAELPISFYYTDEERHAERVKPGSVPRCLIGALSEGQEWKIALL